MQIIESLAELRAALDKARQCGKQIGYVPTMGHLHAGHLSLVISAQTTTDFQVVSIFVNPLQFNRSDDLEQYPRTFEDDCDKLEALGVDIVFAPTVDQIYPYGMETCTKIEVPQLTDRLEGAKRPGHFTGVSTVVNKLLNMVQPQVAVFGRKDLQQLLLIKKMARDLNIPVEIRAGNTIRESDGLAMSSRNSRLDKNDRLKAALINQSMRKAVEAIRSGERDYRKLEKIGLDTLNDAGFRAEYFEVCDANMLQPANEDTESCVILVAAWLGEVRLIDNVLVE